MKNQLKDVLLSIHPKYAEAILNGEKWWEFRKRVFPLEKVRRVYLYATKPVGKIVGYFEPVNIYHDTPLCIWEFCNGRPGIKEDGYFRYFKNKSVAHAIEVGECFRFETPIDPRANGREFHAPQSYKFIDIGEYEE